MVTRTEFEWARYGIQGCLTPATEELQQRLRVGAQLACQSSRCLRLVWLRASNEPDCQLLLICQPISATLSVAEISDELERLWSGNLRSFGTGDRSLHVVEASDEQVVLNGVTIFRRFGLYVTVQIRVGLLCPHCRRPLSRCRRRPRQPTP